MEITKAKPNDLIEVMYLQRICSNDKNSVGLTQNRFPVPDLNELNHKNFIIRDNLLTVGLITFSQDTANDCFGIKWSQLSLKSLFIQMLIVHPNWHERGIGQSLLQFAEKYATENQFTSIRLVLIGNDEYYKSLYQLFNYQLIDNIPKQNSLVSYSGFEKLL